MDASVLTSHAANGGFPQPPKGARLRVVEARHETCGSATRIMLPSVLSARAVRRVQCGGCGEPFEAGDVSEVRSRVPGLPSLAGLRERVSLPELDPSSRTWQLASIPVAAALVIGGLFLIQGGEESNQGAGPPASSPAASEAAPSAPLAEIPGDPSAGAGANGNAAAEIVRGSHFSLALPTGWEKVDPPTGATFTAVAPRGEAEATLWIEEDAGLEFPAFITQTLQQMETLAPNPRVVSRVPGPTPETTVVRLAADPPSGQPSYEAVLRAAGPYRYYLSLTLQPDAGRSAADGLDLIANSLTPEVG